MAPAFRPSADRHVQFRPVDALVLAVLALGVVWLALRAGTVLNYHWHWSALPRFFLRWDAASGRWVPNLLLEGFFATLRLSVWGGAVALAAGLVGGGLRLAPALGLRLIGATYVALIRNIPPLVFVFVVYFFLSTQIVDALGLEAALRGLGPAARRVVTVLFGPPAQVTSFLPGVLALGLFSGAYVAEIVRGGVASVEVSQWEAARALGLGRWATLRKVVLPQALGRMWGPLSNEFILLVKFSSLASLVSVPELTFQAYQVGITTRGMFEVWIVVAGLYFALSAALSALFRHLEHRSRRALEG